MTDEDAPSPPLSPWAQAASHAQADAVAAAPPAGAAGKSEQRELWVSVALGGLAGGGAVLLLGALLMMAGR